MQQEIYETARALPGGAAADEQSLRAACLAAETELVSRLREGLSPSDIGTLFVNAAAMLALSVLSGLEGGSEWSSFKVGSVSVSRGESSVSDGGGDRLRAQAERMLAGYLADDGFCFMGVRG